MQKGSSIVTDNAQLSKNRLYQSITATRYTNPCAIRMYVMSVLHTWLTRFTSTPPADTDRSCVRHLAGSASASDRWRRFRSAPSTASAADSLRSPRPADSRPIHAQQLALPPNAEIGMRQLHQRAPVLNRADQLFFKPVQLHLEPANLFEQRFLLYLTVARLALAAVHK